jgi:NRPS condensation-like uncharacterized protein
LRFSGENLSAASARSVKLNLFQQVMALWEEVWPYNGCCVVQLRGRADFAALQKAIEYSCRQAGVGKLVLDLKAGTYFYEPIESIRLDPIDRVDSIMESLCQFLTEQINTPFPRQPHHPIRWAVLDDSRTDTHFLVVVLHHIAADAVSILLLVRHVLARYYGASRILSARPLRVNAPDYLRVMKHHHWRLGYLRTFLRSLRLYLNLRYVYRMPQWKDRGETSRVLLFDGPPDLIPRLARACRTREVSVHDAFLAALASAIAETTPDRRAQRRRRRLALGTAVDVRPAAAEDLSDCFGLFVGHWVTLINDPDAAEFEMLEQVAQQTRLEKSERRYAGPQWDWRIVLFLHRYFSMKEDRAWYRKVYPLSAGVSNIRMSASWFGVPKEKILGCFLVPPTGPALPLVVSPATVDDQLKLAVVYREAALSDSQVRTLMDLFLTKLEHFSKRDD